MIVELAAWDRLLESECEAIAHELKIPNFRFERIERASQGGVTRFVAIFRHSDGSTFALVPGGTVSLGYDVAQRPRLDGAGEEDWARSMETFGIPGLDEYLSMAMSPARTVVVAPLLVEAAAQPMKRTAGDFDHGALVHRLALDGFRLPTPDEWEYACSAGARSLWRWGNFCPSDEPAYGKIQFTELRRPNAFALSIAQDPYRWEYTTEPLCMRGGDGGDALCGGYGNVISWMALASPFVWPMLDEKSYVDEGFVRRVVTLPLERFSGSP